MSADLSCNLSHAIRRAATKLYKLVGSTASHSDCHSLKSNYYYAFFPNNEACTNCGLCHLNVTEKRKAGEAGLEISEIAKAPNIDVAAPAQRNPGS